MRSRNDSGDKSEKESREGREKGRATDWENKRTKMENRADTVPSRFHSIDDEIHAHFLDIFPEFKFDEAIRDLDEGQMKSVKGKERWRSFIMPVSGRQNGDTQMPVAGLKLMSNSTRRSSQTTTLVRSSVKTRTSCTTRTTLSSLPVSSSSPSR